MSLSPPHSHHADDALHIADATELYPRFSNAEFLRRYQAVRAIMAERGVEALLAYGSPGLDNEVQYLTNVRVTREGLLLFLLIGKPTLFIQYFNHVPNARRVACQTDIRWGGNDTGETLAAELQAHGLSAARIGFAGMLPTQQYLTVRRLLPTLTLINLSSDLRQLRLVKSEEELVFLRRAAELTDRAALALEQHAAPGMTEHELVALIEHAYVGAGGQTGIHYLAATPMTHPTVCVPAQTPSNRRLATGDVLITEISAQYHGYPGQLLRPFTIGVPPTPAYQRMYDVALTCFERIAGVLHDGATTDEVLDIAEDIHDAGYTICDDLLHGLGGGYLPPILRTRRMGASPQPTVTFAENMTVVIQPNVVTPDEQSGVQLGELVRITRGGVERLHQYPLRFTRCG